MSFLISLVSSLCMFHAVHGIPYVYEITLIEAHGALPDLDPATFLPGGGLDLTDPYIEISATAVEPVPPFPGCTITPSTTSTGIISNIISQKQYHAQNTTNTHKKYQMYYMQCSLIPLKLKIVNWIN